MTTPPGGDPRPDDGQQPDDDEGRRDRPTEPIPRGRYDDGPDGDRGDDSGDDDRDPAYDGEPARHSDAPYYDSSYPEDDEYGRVRGTAPVSGPRTYIRPEFTEEELEGLSGGPVMAPRRVLPLEDEPSSLVARYLFPTERYRGEWKRHYIHLTTPLLVGAGTTFVLGYASGFLAREQFGGLTMVVILLWAAVMVWVGWRVGDWFFDRFILTNKRVMVVNGLITRRVAMMPLQRVTDMKYEQSPLGRMLNYGTFVLESAGQEQALREVKHLPNPNELYLRVVEEMYEPQAVEARLSSAKSDEGDDADDGS